MAYTADTEGAYGAPISVLSGPDGLQCQAAIMGPLKTILALASALSALIVMAMPLANAGLDTLALKIGVSAALMMLALAMWRGAREGLDREVELDFLRSVARITTREGRGRPHVRTIPFEALGAMELNGCTIELFARDGSMLATMELDPATAASLR